MEVLYEDTTRLLLETQGLVQELSSFLDGRNKTHLEAKVEENKRQLELDLNRLKTLVSKQPLQYRQEAKSRLDQLTADFSMLTLAIDSYYRRKAQLDDEARIREELFSTSYSASAISPVDGSNQSRQTAIQVDHSLHHNRRLNDAHNSMDELIGVASANLQGLQNQFGILKKARTTLLDVSNTLGLSNTVMRLIERRTTQDKYIFWGGVFITLLVVFLVLRYFL